jgi:hypothetical protein
MGGPASHRVPARRGSKRGTWWARERHRPGSIWHHQRRRWAWGVRLLLLGLGGPESTWLLRRRWREAVVRARCTGGPSGETAGGLGGLRGWRVEEMCRGAGLGGGPGWGHLWVVGGRGSGRHIFKRLCAVSADAVGAAHHPRHSTVMQSGPCWILSTLLYPSSV